MFYVYKNIFLLTPGITLIVYRKPIYNDVITLLKHAHLFLLSYSDVNNQQPIANWEKLDLFLNAIIERILCHYQGFTG